MENDAALADPGAEGGFWFLDRRGGWEDWEAEEAWEECVEGRIRGCADSAFRADGERGP
jgi:hypothetical protein